MFITEEDTEPVKCLEVAHPARVDVELEVALLATARELSRTHIPIPDVQVENALDGPGDVAKGESKDLKSICESDEDKKWNEEQIVRKMHHGSDFPCHSVGHSHARLTDSVSISDDDLKWKSEQCYTVYCHNCCGTTIREVRSLYINEKPEYLHPTQLTWHCDKCGNLNIDSDTDLKDTICSNCNSRISHKNSTSSLSTCELHKDDNYDPKHAVEGDHLHLARQIGDLNTAKLQEIDQLSDRSLSGNSSVSERSIDSAVLLTTTAEIGEPNIAHYKSSWSDVFSDKTDDYNQVACDESLNEFTGKSVKDTITQSLNDHVDPKAYVIARPISYSEVKFVSSVEPGSIKSSNSSTDSSLITGSAGLSSSQKSQIVSAEAKTLERGSTNTLLQNLSTSIMSKGNLNIDNNAQQNQNESSDDSDMVSMKEMKPFRAQFFISNESPSPPSSSKVIKTSPDYYNPTKKLPSAKSGGEEKDIINQHLQISSSSQCNLSRTSLNTASTNSVSEFFMQSIHSAAHSTSNGTSYTGDITMDSHPLTNGSEASLLGRNEWSRQAANITSSQAVNSAESIPLDKNLDTARIEKHVTWNIKSTSYSDTHSSLSESHSKIKSKHYWYRTTSFPIPRTSRYNRFRYSDASYKQYRQCLKEAITRQIMKECSENEHCTEESLSNNKGSAVHFDPLLSPKERVKLESSAENDSQNFHEQIKKQNGDTTFEHSTPQVTTPQDWERSFATNLPIKTTRFNCFKAESSKGSAVQQDAESSKQCTKTEMSANQTSDFLAWQKSFFNSLQKISRLERFPESQEDKSSVVSSFTISQSLENMNLDLKQQRNEDLALESQVTVDGAIKKQTILQPSTKLSHHLPSSVLDSTPLSFPAQTKSSRFERFRDKTSNIEHSVPSILSDSCNASARIDEEFYWKVEKAIPQPKVSRKIRFLTTDAFQKPLTAQNISSLSTDLSKIDTQSLFALSTHDKESGSTAVLPAIDFQSSDHYTVNQESHAVQQHGKDSGSEYVQVDHPSMDQALDISIQFEKQNFF
ncbi:unnamed protein product [Thelazia callipaeda]|uniref:Ubiquitinyl hydrolase 1 n=1 Tax=Thelazia callipaeda TaxID=103827 RepID=A0A158RB41_THECL|nr:unnamed protein product [Thelazia callipaeda]